jgi:hypothetical protein
MQCKKFNHHKFVETLAMQEFTHTSPATVQGFLLGAGAGYRIEHSAGKSLKEAKARPVPFTRLVQ